MSSYIESINQASTASTGKSTTKTKDNVSMGKQDFLTLLVAQLQNQDPLNPDDATEFTAQLAQFSSLEQLTNLNTSMDKLVSSNTSSDNLSTLSTIGKEVAYTGSSFKYAGEPIQLGYKLDADATEVTLTLQQKGITVATIQGTDLTAGNHYITWDGLAKDGSKAPSGDYKIVLQANAKDGKSVTASSLIKSEVTGVDLNGQSGGTLITKAGETPFSSVIGVYEPGTRTGTTATATETKKETTAEIKKTAEAVAEVKETVDTIAEIAADANKALL